MTRQAWLTGRLSLSDPKKYPKLETLIQGETPRKPQTQEQMLSIVKAMNAAMGGKVIRRA